MPVVFYQEPSEVAAEDVPAPPPVRAPHLPATARPPCTGPIPVLLGPMALPDVDDDISPYRRETHIRR